MGKARPQVRPDRVPINAAALRCKVQRAEHVDAVAAGHMLDLYPHYLEVSTLYLGPKNYESLS